MLRIIAVRTGDKFDQWYEDNLKYMIDTHSQLKYDEFVVIRDDQYEGVFNKLLMFDRYRDGQNLYFDLDVVIKGNCNHFLRSDLTVCHAWWRDAWHTPLNSSIISWTGDVSHIHDMFAKDPEYYMLKYEKGIDQYLYENFIVETYNEQDKYCSFQTVKEKLGYDVYLFNQMFEQMKQPGWIHEFQLPL